MFRQLSLRTNHLRFVAACLILITLATCGVAVAEKEQVNKQVRPLPPAPPMDVLAKQVKEKYHSPVYAIKIATKDAKTGKITEVGTFLTSEGVPGSISIGKTRYTYGVSPHDAKNANIGFSWEELVDLPKEINGEMFWTSRCTEKQIDAPFGKDAIIEITAPDDRTRRQTFVLNVREYDFKAQK